ncbi:MAG TPA: hypothetical protein VF003_06990 [Pseudonocardiaceae bacterium]
MVGARHGLTGEALVDGGVTATNNCCLLCPAHHHQVHLQGWEVAIHGGRVEFRPPALIDPNRRPLPTHSGADFTSFMRCCSRRSGGRCALVLAAVFGFLLTGIEVQRWP